MSVIIRNKYLYLISAVVIFLVGVGMVVSYTVNPGVIPSPVGHALSQIQGYFQGDANLNDSLGKFCQSDGTNCPPLGSPPPPPPPLDPPGWYGADPLRSCNHNCEGISGGTLTSGFDSNSNVCKHGSTAYDRVGYRTNPTYYTCGGHQLSACYCVQNTGTGWYGADTRESCVKNCQDIPGVLDSGFDSNGDVCKHGSTAYDMVGYRTNPTYYTCGGHQLSACYCT